MTKESEAIVSSTGKLGVSRRPDERLCVNGTSVSDDPATFNRNIRRLFAAGERHSSSIGRSMFRGVVSHTVLEHVLQTDLRSHLEVSLPLSEFTGDKSHLIYMAKNRPGREQITPTEVMRSSTERQRSTMKPPRERVDALVASGYTFIDCIQNEDQANALHALWGTTFGWERHEVDNFRRRLLRAREEDPLKKSVWFSAIRNEKTILSVAMAERLTIPAETGYIDLVENTEWRTGDGYEGKGLLTATIAMLNAQILADFRVNPNGLPVIYPECNFQSRADLAGYGAGFRIPSRAHASQILVQNVGVQDGAPVEGKLRDFTFMYLPREIIERDYAPAQVHAMMSRLRR